VNAVNPVVPGFYPDPSVCRVGSDYYAAFSSFEYFPGVPVFHSRDLVSWTQIGHALDRPGQLDLTDTHSSGGVYAPTLRHHDGRFWLATTCVSSEGHLIVSATDPAGPWSDPVTVPLEGIDPDLAWDDEGTCWFTYSGHEAPGRPSCIMQTPIDPGTGTVLGAPKMLWPGTGLAYPEAPHLYQAHGRWYLVIAEGGTERGHAVSVARSAHPSGPFEGCPQNPVLSHRSTTSSIQNTGHADLVQTADGQWYALLLGTRPRGGNTGYHVLGRETFRTAVRWTQDEWPILEPLVEGAEPGRGVSVRDTFDGGRLGPGWVSLRRPLAQVADLGTRPGRLTLSGSGDPLDSRSATFVGRRQQHLRFAARAAVDASDGVGGLVLRMDERHYYALEASAERVRCVARIGPLTQEIGAVNVAGESVLSIESVPVPDELGGPCGPPDLVRLGVVGPDGLTVVAELDGRYLSTEVAGGFTGRMVGMYARDGSVGFEWFDYESTGSSGSSESTGAG
jgi:beta-xylosidase